LTFQYFSLTWVNDREGVRGVNCPGTEAMNIVRSLTEYLDNNVVYSFQICTIRE
jgi:hypothetical protein